MATEKTTELIPALCPVTRRGAVRPVHLRRVVKVRIGSDFRGEPVYTAYPDKAALCGVKNAELCGKDELEPTCRKCIKAREGVTL